MSGFRGGSDAEAKPSAGAGPDAEQRWKSGRWPAARADSAADGGRLVAEECPVSDISGGGSCNDAAAGENGNCPDAGRP